MAIKSFGDRATQDLANGVNSKQARKLPQRIWKTAQRQLDALGSARTLQDLSLPGLALEALKYTKPGFYSIKINDQYRILFRFEGGDAYEVYIEGEDHTGRR